MQIGKLALQKNRRDENRRADCAHDLDQLLSTRTAFDRCEQKIFKLVDRRKLLRRAEDLRQAMTRLGS